MLLLNFSHPLTLEQQAHIEALAGRPIDDGRNIQAQFENSEPFAGQAAALADTCNLTSEEWQTRPILIIPPALNFIAVTLLAELHGRMGYFPSIVRMRPAANSLQLSFEVAEIINLQVVRDNARRKR